MAKAFSQEILVDNDIRLVQEFPSRTRAIRLANLLKKNKARLQRFFPGVYMNALKYEDVMNILHHQNSHFKQNEAAFYHIYYQNTPSFIGKISLLNYNQSTEISYWIDADLEGKGIISRAFDGVRENLFSKNIPQISSYCNESNNRSLAFLEHKGLKKVGVVQLAGKEPLAEFIQNRLDFLKSRSA